MKKAMKRTGQSSNRKAATASSIAGKRRITFELTATPGSAISLAGSFNNWDPKTKVLKDKNNDGNYRCIVMLKPGIYEYKYCINGDWHADPKNPNFTPNNMGTLNSIIEVN